MELLVLDVHALHRLMPPGKSNTTGSLKCGVTYQPRSASQITHGCHGIRPATWWIRTTGSPTFGPIGGVFVIGVGRLALGVLLMIACAVRLRAFFRGETLSEDTPILVPGTAELPAALSESAQRKCALEAP
jgi:hypothetical protein